MMNLTEAQVATIIYEKVGGEVTTRTIIPTSLPTDLVRAIDVTELPLAEREQMLTLYKEYKQYVEDFKANMFDFSTWIEHTQGKQIEPKWRSFKSSGLRT
jgi:hypothetical protein